MNLRGRVYDIRVVSCESAPLQRACLLTVAATDPLGGDTEVRLLVRAQDMGDGDWLSACARRSLLKVIDTGNRAEAFDYS